MLPLALKSRSSRSAWIEISSFWVYANRVASRSSRSAWIEIVVFIVRYRIYGEVALLAERVD